MNDTRPLPQARLAASILLLFVLAVAACSEKKTSIVPLKLDPATLLSSSELETITGHAFPDEPEITWLGDEKVACSLSYFRTAPMFSIGLLVRSSPLDPAREYSQTLSSYRAEFGDDHRVEEISGLGSAAFFDPQLGQVVVFTEEHYLNVTVMSGEPIDRKELTESIARLVLPRLQ